MGNCAYAWVCPVGAEIGIESDYEVNLNCRATQLFECFGTKQIVLDPEKIGIHGRQSGRLVIGFRFEERGRLHLTSVLRRFG